MKAKGHITILVNRDVVEVEIMDGSSRQTFIKIELTPEQFCAALSRLSNVDCEVQTFNLDRVGKTHENKDFIFEIPEELRGSKHSDALWSMAFELCEEGWKPDNYFGSQDSFFTKDGKQYARCTVRRWI